jgi:tetratricopeptide (TPR) repeat protein
MPERFPHNQSQPGSGRSLESAVGYRLAYVLWLLLLLTSLTTATGLWLSGVRIAQWLTGLAFEDLAYVWAFLLHLVTGILSLAPFVVFGIGHVLRTHGHANSLAARRGWVLLAVCVVMLVSGLALLRLDGIAELRHPASRSVVYWLHVTIPAGALLLYLRHRWSGPAIRWRSGMGYVSSVIAVPAVLLIVQQMNSPDVSTATTTSFSEASLLPSAARSHSGHHIQASALDRSDYCMECHEDAHADWNTSAHHFSSFNNPAYLTAAAEARDAFRKRDGDVSASRWCAGCHDPVPLFSGDLDDPDYDMIDHPTASAGITCTVCHAITEINSTKGNADYTINEPQHYPFSTSTHEFFRWVNHQLIKARPAFHKQTFLKDFHESAEFCSTCHKAHVPFAVNHYREFTRGQNHYDSWLLSGVSGHGARSFYYPDSAEENCNGCHMPLKESTDFGARPLAPDGGLQIHDHLFPGANTAIPWWENQPDTVNAHQEFMKGSLRVDLFGIRQGDTLSSHLTAPLGPHVPVLHPGKTYLLETVIRSLNVGHHFTQGTSDSNQIWLEVTATVEGREIAVNGRMNAERQVDPRAHFVHSFLLDHTGRRIDRRNVQDILVPLYDHQIAPGSAQTIHYRLNIPQNTSAPVTVQARLLYRKFDEAFRQLITQAAKASGHHFRNDGPLPVTVIAFDSVTFPTNTDDQLIAKTAASVPEWERWNDYGIGLFLNGHATLLQAANAFRQVELLGRVDGPLNRARVHLAEGGQDAVLLAADAVRRAELHNSPAGHPWTLHWLAGRIQRQLGNLNKAAFHFRKVLNMQSSETIRRGLDLSRDYVVNNLLGRTIFDVALQLRSPAQSAQRHDRLLEAITVFQRTLQLDSENLDAHHNLAQLYLLVGDPDRAVKHRELHAKYHPDDTARGLAAEAARARYPAANAAAEAVTIYDLHPLESIASED